jgi:hypothetical protein
MLRLRSQAVLRTRLVASLRTGLLLPEREVILFDGELRGTGLLVFSINPEIEYLELHIIASEWTTVIPGERLPSVILTPPGRLTVRAKNIQTFSVDITVGDLWEVWLE